MTNKLHQIYAGVDMDDEKVFSETVFHTYNSTNKAIHSLFAKHNVRTFEQARDFMQDLEDNSGYIMGVGDKFRSSVLLVLSSHDIHIIRTANEITQIIFENYRNPRDMWLNAKVQKALKNADITTIDQLISALNSKIPWIWPTMKESVVKKLSEMWKDIRVL